MGLRGGGILGSLPALARLSLDSRNWAIGEPPLGLGWGIRDLLIVVRGHRATDRHMACMEI